jgi:hypothetical protein
VSRRAWFALLFLLATLLAACAKPLPAEHKDLVGTWKAPDMLLVITADGRVSYKRVRGGNDVSLDAPIQDVGSDGFSAGLGPMTTQFRIDQRPMQREDGTWTMTIDGVVLTRTDAPGTVRL